MMYYIKAKVVIRVAGISGPWEAIISYLVNAPNLEVAKQKYELQVRKDKSNMDAQSFKFEYIEIATEIK